VSICRVLAACALCGTAIVGCGGSTTHSGATPKHSQPRPTTVNGLCSTPCTDGQQDYVDHVRILPNTTAGASHTVVSMRLRVKNVSSQSASIDPRIEVDLIDSQQQSSTPDNVLVAYADGRRATPPECPGLSPVTLIPGDSHTFKLCFGLAGPNDIPRVLRLPGSAEIPLN
jgi:hypothetical protein